MTKIKERPGSLVEETGLPRVSKPFAEMGLFNRGPVLSRRPAPWSFVETFVVPRIDWGIVLGIDPAAESSANFVFFERIAQWS